MIICFTGHRKNPPGAKEQFKEALRGYLGIYREDISLAISGMALGVDTWAFDVCNEHNIGVLAAVPFKGQEAKWSWFDRQAYSARLSQAVGVEYVCPPGYQYHKYEKRNKWMVDHSDLVVAYYDGLASGGTAQCVRYATHKSKPVVNLWGLE